jgi:DNA replication factor GINS
LLDELYEAWKRDLENRELQPLSADFFEKIADYLHRLKEDLRMTDDRTLNGRLKRLEYEKATRLSLNLMQLRQRKILQIACERESLPSNLLTEQEQRYYDRARQNQETMLRLQEQILEGRMPLPEERDKEPERRTMVLRFLSDMPSIVGSDMRIYGPFRKEDVAVLPLENAETLLRQELVQRVET